MSTYKNILKIFGGFALAANMIACSDHASTIDMTGVVATNPSSSELLSSGTNASSIVTQSSISITSSNAGTSSSLGKSSVAGTSSSITSTTSSTTKSSSATSSQAASSSAAVVSSSTVAQSSASGPCTNIDGTNTVTDCRDGQPYNTVKIGTQVWMAQNLNYSGDNGAGARTYTTGWCYGIGGADTTIHTDDASCAAYGRNYDWTDAMGIARTYLTTTWAGDPMLHQGVCPNNWHLPTVAEWDQLATQIRTDKTATAGTEGKFLKVVDPGNTSWNAAAFNMQDPYGFGAYPAGYLGAAGAWTGRGTYTDFWTATTATAGTSNSRTLKYNDALLTATAYSKLWGFSVRCVKD